VQEVTEKALNKTFEEALDESPYAGSVTIKGDKLKIPGPVAHDLFQVNSPKRAQWCNLGNELWKYM